MAALVLISGIASIGVLDLVTGVEVRVYPLYFVPLCMGSWKLGARGAWAGSALAALVWFVSNRIAGLEYSSQAIWFWNFGVQAIAFLAVSLLVARMHGLLANEEVAARTDALTGLDNRRSFIERLERVAAEARRYEHAITIAYLDIDNFKGVNDRLGHVGGDGLLCTFAKALRNELRDSDCVARFGGDEFVICLSETGEVGAKEVLSRIVGSLNAAIQAPPYSVSVSVGAVAWTRLPASVEVMILAADKHMYDVKRSGKNSVSVVAAEDRADA